jgi:hypothetical protein
LVEVEAEAASHQPSADASNDDNQPKKKKRFFFF